MVTEENIIIKLTAKDDKYACALADKIISESHETDKWYKYFDDFASLLDHPKSLVRNRVLHILAANAQWDVENRFDSILSDFLTHVADEKPITTRQCVKALAQVGLAKPQYIPGILSSLQHADLSKYKNSMHFLFLPEDPFRKQSKVSPEQDPIPTLHLLHYYNQIPSNHSHHRQDCLWKNPPVPLLWEAYSKWFELPLLSDF